MGKGQQFGPIYGPTLRAALDARLTGTAWGVLACMLFESRPWGKCRQEVRDAASAYLAENAPHVAVESVRCASVSIDQLVELSGKGSRRYAQDGLRELMGARLLVRVSKGKKKHPAAYMIGPVPEKSEGPEEPEERQPWADPSQLPEALLAQLREPGEGGETWE